MTDTNMLRAIIKKKGLKYTKIAEKLGITGYSLQKKIENKSEFKASEINKLCEILDIKLLQTKEALFFTKPVDK